LWEFYRYEDGTQPKKKPRILCLGGSYVAIYLTKALCEAARRGEIDFTVVDVKNFQCFHGLIPEMLTGEGVRGLWIYRNT
jgi:NADH dehydrogenase FAD-containing subunit